MARALAAPGLLTTIFRYGGTAMTPLIRFAHGACAALRQSLLRDSTREHFAMLTARRESSPDGREIFVIQEVFMAEKGDILASGLCHVRPSREFVARVLSAAQRDMRVNAVFDVHTHPFCDGARFSGIDDADERRFSLWLRERFGQTPVYGSIVFSRSAYEARIWDGATMRSARLRTQTLPEAVPCRFTTDRQDEAPEMQARTALALGADVIRRIARRQRIVLAGVGGIGSVLAEQLVRSGFTRLGLIDPDVLELTNLNRFAGGYRADVGRPKVEVTAAHLRRINPDVRIRCVADTVESADAVSLMAAADWIIVSTDSHASRQSVQDTALRFGVPLLSAGVSITVNQKDGRHRIVDESGEVITARHGDGYCLHCLGRIDPYVAAAEAHPDPAVREGLVQKGYVRGLDVKEPAVMPLNAVVASITVRTLLEQYRDDGAHQPVVVYESHAGHRLYPDTESLALLPDFCPACGRDVRLPVTGGQNGAAA